MNVSIMNDQSIKVARYLLRIVGYSEPIRFLFIIECSQQSCSVYHRSIVQEGAGENHTRLWTSLAINSRLNNSLAESRDYCSLHVNDRYGSSAAFLHHLIPFLLVLAHVVFDQVHA